EKTDYSFTDPRLKELNSYSTKLIKELIIPKLTKEVNSSKRYASLRQVYYSLIMAQWFKARYHSQRAASSLRALEGRSNLDSNVVNLIDSKNLSSLTSKTPWNKQDYFNQYQQSFTKGEYNTKETVYTPSGQVIRSYMSGGIRIMPEGIVSSSSPLNKTSSPTTIIAGSSSVLIEAREGLSQPVLFAIPGTKIDSHNFVNSITASAVEKARAGNIELGASTNLDNISSSAVKNNIFQKTISLLLAAITFLSVFSWTPVSTFGADKSTKTSVALPQALPGQSGESDSSVKALLMRLESANLFTFSSKDIFAILEWRLDGRMLSFFGYLYEWYHVSHPQISKEEFKEYVKNLEPVAIRQLIVDYLVATIENQEEGGVPRKWLDEKLKILESQEFKTLFNELNVLYQISNADNPAYEVFRILNKENQGKARYLTALRSQEFQEFCQFLRNNYGINPNNKLILVLDAYFDPPTLNAVKSNDTQKACRMFKKYFSSIKLNDIDFIFFVLRRVVGHKDFAEKFKNGEFEKLIVRTADDYNLLVKNYNLRLTEYYLSLGELFRDYYHKIVERLRSDKAHRIWQYYQEHYLNKTQTVSLDVLEKADEIINLTLSLDVDVEVFDQFLRMFGLNLETVVFTQEMRFMSNGQELHLAFTDLLRNNDFRQFVDGLLIQYPDLKKKVSTGTFNSSIADICYVYLNREAFEELNSNLRKSISLSVPIFDLDCGNLLLEIAHIVQEKFPKIVLRSEDIKNINSSKLRIVLHFLNQSPIGGELYKRLVDDWGLQEIYLDDFALILSRPEKLGFYLSKENAHKFIKLSRMYSIVGGFTKGQPQEISEISDLYDAERILQYFNFFINDGTYDLIRKYLSTYFNNSKIAISDFDFRIDSAVPILSDPQFLKIAKILEEKFGIKSEEVLILLGEKIPPGYLDRISDPQIEKAFIRLKKFYQLANNPADNRSLFIQALDVGANAEESVIGLRLLQDLGFDIKGDKEKNSLAASEVRYNYFQYFKKFILSQKLVMNSLKDPAFRSFYLRIMQIFYDGAINIEAVPELCEIFQHTTIAQRNMFEKKEFQAVLSFVRTEFNITDLHYSTLFPLLTIAQNFNQKKWDVLLARLKAQGEKISANDLILLNAVIKDKSLERRLFDRRGLTKGAVKVYNTKSAPRKSLDMLTKLKSDLRFAKEMNVVDSVKKIEQQINSIKNTYTERPDLSSLSNIELLRINLLQDSLRQAKFLERIGKVISNDIKDTTTEYGGIIMMSGSRLHLNNVKSHSEFDGSYVNSKYTFFIDGMASFHLHALEIDSSEYSGPSGWVGKYGGGDAACADIYKGVDVVITTMGHPRGKDGKPNTGKVLFNADIYWVNQEGNLVIVDLGIHETTLGSFVKTASAEKASSAVNDDSSLLVIQEKKIVSFTDSTNQEYIKKLLLKIEKKSKDSISAGWIDAYLKDDVKEINCLQTSDIAEEDLPYSVVMREQNKHGFVPSTLSEVPLIQDVRLPSEDVFLISKAMNGSAGVVKLGFLKDGRPVALKAYFTNRPLTERFMLMDYQGAYIADVLGIGPKVHGLFVDQKAKWLVMDIVSGDFLNVARQNIKLVTYRDLREIKLRLQNANINAMEGDFQYYITPQGRILIIDQGALAETEGYNPQRYYRQLVNILTWAFQEVRQEIILDIIENEPEVIDGLASELDRPLSYVSQFTKERAELKKQLRELSMHSSVNNLNFSGLSVSSAVRSNQQLDRLAQDVAKEILRIRPNIRNMLRGEAIVVNGKTKTSLETIVRDVAVKNKVELSLIDSINWQEFAELVWHKVKLGKDVLKEKIKKHLDWQDVFMMFIFKVKGFKGLSQTVRKADLDAELERARNKSPSLVIDEIIDEARRIMYYSFRPVFFSENDPGLQDNLNEYVELPAQKLVRRILANGGIPFASNAFGPNLKGVWWQKDGIEYFSELNLEDYDFKELENEPLRPRLQTVSSAINQASENAVKNSFLKKELIDYWQMFAKIVNQQEKDLVVAAGASGADVSGVLFATNFSKAYFIDNLQVALDKLIAEHGSWGKLKLFRSCLTTKFSKGFTDITELERYGIESLIMLELEALGVRKEDVGCVLDERRRPKLTFKLPGEEKAREIIFVKQNLREESLELNNELGGKIDVYFERASFGLPYFYDVIIKNTKTWLKDNGFILVDSHTTYDENVSMRQFDGFGLKEVIVEEIKAKAAYILNKIMRNKYGWKFSLWQKKDPVVNRAENKSIGGIDFRSLPIVTQAISSLGLTTINQELKIRLMNFNLRSELNEIERLTSIGITPSTQRIKEYIQASSISTDNSPEDTQKLLSCIADILRKQEEECCTTDPTLKDVLVILESGVS
ncbi:MAG: hypothetical protein HZC15_07305, partial [Candidatus Omnitrophica bacterium]|nr:hypothetical protein [Candidatus Omnitrophota bacterium]